ncbi:hypothetical protein I4F81_011173 [Pyropia yezoensis]|uniref:Uncharacterized protein n=2 Tax=Pyropia yezoensis TaxID=2788 RepID=A0ACC3CF17_PYRYE|nr:hypothetical protein I4F81_011173 [Neopyropia yezoensis]
MVTVRRPRRLWCAAALLSAAVFSPCQLARVAAEGPPLLGDGTISISSAPYDLHTKVNGTGPPPRWWSCPSRWEWASLTSTADLGATDLPSLAATGAHVGGDPAECHPDHTLPVYTGSGVALYGRGWKRRRHSEAAAYALAHTITRHDPARAFVIPENAYSCGGGRLLLGADSLLLFAVAPSAEDLEALDAARPGAADYYRGVPPGVHVLLYVHGEHPSRDPVCVRGVVSTLPQALQEGGFTMPPKFDPTAVTEIFVRTTGGEVGAVASLAPKIGPLGLSPKKIGDQLAKATKEWKGLRVMCKLTVVNRQATVTVVPSAASMIIKALKEPERDRKKVKNIAHDGNLTMDAIIEVAKNTRRRSMAVKMEGTVKEVLGTAQSVGCTVDGQAPHDIIEAIDAGEVEVEDYEAPAEE